MADDADKSATGVATTPGDEKRDGKEPTSQGDTPPKKRRGRPPGSKNRAASAVVGGEETASGERSKAWLVKRLNGICKSPAFVFESMGEEWPKTHVDEQGENLAKAIAAHAERNPAFKLRLVAMLEGGETAGLVVAGAMYLVPLLLYFNVLPIPPAMRARIPIPQRGIGMPAAVVPEEFREAMEREAKEKGFDSVEAYEQAINNAVANVRGDAATV